MSSIRTGIELNDQFTSVIYGIINSVNLAVSSMVDMQKSMNADIDTSSIEATRDEINQATIAMDELNQAMQNQVNPSVTNVDAPVQAPTSNPVQSPIISDQSRAPPEPIEVPVICNTDGLDALTNALSVVQQKITAMESNPLSLGADTADAELGQLRSELDQAIWSQNNLNTAADNLDVSDANSAYMTLSQTISSTEQSIKGNTDEQEQFNREVQEGSSQANHLVNTIKGAVAAYISIKSVTSALNISDELTQTTSRLNMMNDGLQSTQELTRMVYAAAQDSRGSFSDMASVVAKFGNNAKEAFSSSKEVVAFADLVQKQMTIAGASTSEASNAMLQLSQALGSGVLRGDELNSIFEQAPNLIQNIADYLDVDIGQIREMAAQGQITADIVKASMFAAADDINTKFEQMPMTWGQIWQSMQNTAIMAFQPVLQRLNDIANSDAFQSFVNGAVEAMATLANIVLNIFDLIGAVGSFIADNWSIIEPIIMGIVTALGLYYGAMLLYNAITGISAGITAAKTLAEQVHTAATAMQTGATFAATAAQYGFNTALLACPLTWIVLLIIALIAVIFAVCGAIAKMTGVANSGFGVITGGINVVIEFFKNLGLSIADIALGIGDAIAALGSNIMTAFHNAICSVQAWWYDLLSTALTVVEGICEALNKLPFVEFDYSGITSAANDYAAKSAEAAAGKESYKSISDAFNEGMSTFDTFQDGWVSDAFDAGAAWGDGIADKVSNFSLSDIFGKTDMPNTDDYSSALEGAMDSNGAAGNLDAIAGNTGSMADSMDLSEEDLKYLRDIAETETVNRYTVAEINIDQSGMQNTIKNGDNLDGFMSGLTDSVNEAVDSITEGVHE